MAKSKYDKYLKEWTFLRVDCKFSAIKIGKMFGVSRSAVHNFLVRRGVLIRSQIRSPETIIKLIMLYEEEKFSYSEVGKLMGCSPATVRYHCQRRGVKSRSKSEAMLGKYVGEKGLFYGRHHSKESKKKSSLSNIGKHVHKGADNPNWKGGVHKLPYAFEFTEELKQKIKIRDSFICQHSDGNCKGKLCVHHIDYDKMNCRENNLITLCNSHNLKVNKNREYWTRYFTAKLDQDDIRYSIIPAVV